MGDYLFPAKNTVRKQGDSRGTDNSDTHHSVISNTTVTHTQHSEKALLSHSSNSTTPAPAQWLYSNTERAEALFSCPTWRNRALVCSPISTGWISSSQGDGASGPFHSFVSQQVRGGEAERVGGSGQCWHASLHCPQKLYLVLLCMGGGSVHLHTVPNGYMSGKVNRLLMHPPVIAGLNSMPA